MTRLLLLVLLVIPYGMVAALLFWNPSPVMTVVVTAGIIGLLCLDYLVWHWLRNREQRQSARLRVLQESHDELQSHRLQLERHCHALLEGMHIPIIVCQQDSSVLYANGVALSWFDFRNVSGKSLLALSFAYDLYVLFQTCVRRRARVDAEIHLTFPIERHVHASLWPLPAPDVDEEVIAIALLDRTEVARVEQVRRDFVANVSHEFRTPLASVRALAETIMDDEQMPAATRERFLNMIVHETERLARIADDLLVLTRAESRTPEVGSFDLVSLILRVTEQLRPEAVESGVEFHSELPAVLTVQASYDQMVQVVLNLLSNAIRYNRPEGHVYVRGKSQDGQIVLEVEDTGIGILSEDLPRIFERFYRVDKARSREAGGTGLGLSIVKHIVEAHGGRVEVASEYRQGTTFRVYLPGA
jgi:two-component system phosphate regulon sensor histidine kinase PhoR